MVSVLLPCLLKCTLVPTARTTSFISFLRRRSATARRRRSRDKGLPCGEALLDCGAARPDGLRRGGCLPDAALRGRDSQAEPLRARAAVDEGLLAKSRKDDIAVLVRV